MDIDIDTPLAIARQAGYESVKAHIDSVLMTQFGYMPISSSTSAALIGFNHRQGPIAYEFNREQFGYTFFTRPDLNFSAANCYQDRRLSSLMQADKLNVQSWIRHTLDPRLHLNDGKTCPLVDELQPWIPLWTNSAIAVSGWPALNPSIGSNAPSRYGDNVSFYNGNIKDLVQEFNLTVNFQNMAGQFGLTMAFFWIYAASLAQMGITLPHMAKSWADCSMNYTTRIIRLIMDPFKRFIVDWCAAESALIQSVPKGDSYTYESTGVFNTTYDQYSIPFKCSGFAPADPIILKEFNDLTVQFNPNMADGKRSNTFVKIPPELLNAMNGNGYPWIDLATQELEWWLPPEKFIELKQAKERFGSAPLTSTPR